MPRSIRRLTPLWEAEDRTRAYAKARRRAAERLRGVGVSEPAAMQIAYAASDPLWLREHGLGDPDGQRPERALEPLWPDHQRLGLWGVTFQAWTTAVLPNVHAPRFADRQLTLADRNVTEAHGRSGKLRWPPLTCADRDQQRSCELTLDAPDAQELTRRLRWMWQIYRQGDDGQGPVVEPLRCAIVHYRTADGVQPLLMALSGGRRLAWLHRTLGSSFTDMAALASPSGVRAGAGVLAALRRCADLRASADPQIAAALTVPVTVPLLSLPTAWPKMGAPATLDVWAQFEHHTGLMARSRQIDDEVSCV